MVVDDVGGMREFMVSGFNCSVRWEGGAFDIAKEVDICGGRIVIGWEWKLVWGWGVGWLIILGSGGRWVLNIVLEESVGGRESVMW